MVNTEKNFKDSPDPEKHVSIKKEVPAASQNASKEKRNIVLISDDNPIPLVIPPHETRTLKMRNVSSKDVEMKITMMNGPVGEHASDFEIDPSETTVKPNELLPIRITYNAVEEKYDPEGEKQKRTTRSKSTTTTVVSESFTKKQAILQVTVRENGYLYVFPILGSDDPKDEALAMQRHINLSKVKDSDDEESLIESPKSKRQTELSARVSKKVRQDPKLTKEVTIVLERTTHPLANRRIPNIVIKEEVDGDMEIEDVPIV